MIKIEYDDFKNILGCLIEQKKTFTIINIKNGISKVVKEIEKSIRIINGAKEAEAKGSGVISVDGKMVDNPIIMRAQRVLELAKASGIYKED